MKVLFHAYNTCCQTASGGVQVRVRKIKAHLEARGIQVDFFSAFETKLKDYDVLHIFALHAETAGLISTAKKLGLKVVISTIVNILPSKAKAIDNSLRFSRFLSHYGMDTLWARCYKAVDSADTIIVETPEEARFINKHLRKPMKDIVVISNGVDEQKEVGDVAYDIIGSRKPYILQVGRIEGIKNTLSSIKAVKGANYNLVLVGGEFAGKKSDYYEQCLKEAGDNVKFLGWLPSESDELLSVYQHAQALIIPSISETFGMVCLEGAMAGTHVCLSNTLPILDFDVFDRDLTFDPHDIKQIRKVMDKVISMPKDRTTYQKAKEIFSWNSVIDKHIELYKC